MENIINNEEEQQFEESEESFDDIIEYITSFANKSSESSLVLRIVDHIIQESFSTINNEVNTRSIVSNMMLSYQQSLECLVKNMSNDSSHFMNYNSDLERLSRGIFDTIRYKLVRTVSERVQKEIKEAITTTIMNAVESVLSDKTLTNTIKDSITTEDHKSITKKYEQINKPSSYYILEMLKHQMSQA